MDNQKDDQYYIGKMITDLSFLLAHTKGLAISQLESEEVLLDSVMFRMIQISENAEKLTDTWKQSHPNIPWRAIKGLRNRIVHEYGNVDLSVIYDTVKNDLPYLLTSLQETAQ